MSYMAYHERRVIQTCVGHRKEDPEVEVVGGCSKWWTQVIMKNAPQ